MTRRRYLIILPMVIVIAINAMDRVNFAVWIPALQKDWHCSLAPNGDISFVWGMAYALFNFPRGWLTDKLGALRQGGPRVPQGVSVMSIDELTLAAILDVPLTAVHVSRDVLGSEAVQVLQPRRRRPWAPYGARLLYGALVVRASVRRIRAGNRRGEVSSEGGDDDRRGRCQYRSGAALFLQYTYSAVRFLSAISFLPLRGRDDSGDKRGRPRRLSAGRSQRMTIRGEARRWVIGWAALCCCVH